MRVVWQFLERQLGGGRAVRRRRRDLLFHLVVALLHGPEVAGAQLTVLQGQQLAVQVDLLGPDLLGVRVGALVHLGVHGHGFSLGICSAVKQQETRGWVPAENPSITRSCLPRSHLAFPDPGLP